MSGETSHLGRYRLLSVLGRGGMGTVHLAEDPTGLRVAVKVINPELGQHEQFRMRFRREAEAAQRVRRFCTAAVIEATLDGDQLYVVTEYVSGPNLEEAVRHSGPLRGSSLDALAVSVATALTAVHAAGVVHRDLKPSNVLLSPVGPRVIDFGIARALDTLGSVTSTGEIVGTPRYMAPEVLRGDPVSPPATCSRGAAWWRSRPADGIRSSATRSRRSSTRCSTPSRTSTPSNPACASWSPPPCTRTRPCGPRRSNCSTTSSGGPPSRSRRRTTYRWRGSGPPSPTRARPARSRAGAGCTRLSRRPRHSSSRAA
ncbi:serine/threonine-protein kinase [Nonomuraea antimicrobica]